MRRALLLLLLLPLLLSGCGPLDTGPRVNIPPQCEREVYADPAVRDIIAKGAGSDGYRLTHENTLAYAKIDATTRCLQQKGMLPPGGGVERPRVTD